MDYANLIDLVVEYGFRVVVAISALFIGLFIIKIISKIFTRTLKNRKVDETLHPFLSGLVATLLKVALVISLMGMVGIKTTSFVAILGAAGLAVGMALQGSLGNFAGGVLILIFKPFKVGDLIEAQGYTGVVKEVGIFCSVLRTGDNKTIILPNGPLAGGAMINYSTEENRRVDWVFGISYGDDIKKAQNLLLEILNSHDKILKEPESFARVGELADSSVNFTVRGWVKSEDYWSVYFDVIEKVKIEFDESGISFPFPQQELHFANAVELKK